MSELIENEPQVVQNSDFLSARPFETIPEQLPQPINEFERRMLEGTKSVTQLLAEETTPEVITERQQRKNLITMYKVVALDMIGKHPLSNPSGFFRKDKELLLNKMEELLKLYDEEQIKPMFNEVCTNKIFNQDSDYTVFPVYNNI